MNRHLVQGAVLVAIGLALTGCSLTARSSTVPASPQPSSSVQTSAMGSVPPPVPYTSAGADAAAAGTLDGISQDLNSADGANAQTDVDQHSADQATSANDG